MANLSNSFRDDMSELERLFSATVSETGDTTILDFDTNAGAQAFGMMMEEPRRAGTQSTLHGRFSQSFLAQLADAQPSIQVKGRAYDPQLVPAR